MKSSSASSDMHTHTPAHTAVRKSPVVSQSFTAALLASYLGHPKVTSTLFVAQQMKSRLH